MNKLVLPFLAAVAIVAAPVAQASVTSDFKAELKTKVGSKTGTAAAKAAAKTIAKYVVAAPKGDPKKVFKFTKLGVKAIKNLSANAPFVTFWSQFVTLNYFKKGKITYNPAEKNYAKALAYVYKLIKGDETNVNKAFKQLSKNNSKLKGTDSDLLVLQQEVADASGVVPVS